MDIRDKIRGAGPLKLQRTLSGDLDHILLKALRKEPQRRYPSAQAFAEDLRAYSLGLPVSSASRHVQLPRQQQAATNSLAATAVVFAMIMVCPVRWRLCVKRALHEAAGPRGTTFQ